MVALKVTTTTMVATSSSISTIKQPARQWMRRIPPSPPSPTTTVKRVLVISSASAAAMSKSYSAVINRRGERMSVWWRDGWRMISCADFGWGSHQKLNSFGPRAPSSSTFSSSSTTTKNNINMEEERDDDIIKAPKLLTIPTILTLGRVAAIPLLVTTFYNNSSWATTVTTSIFIAAAITDWLDGYLARRMHLGTPFGAFLDPVADKLMVAATLVLLCTRPLEVGAFGEISWLLPIPSIAIIGREITMSAVREWAASQNGKVLEAVAVNNLGKWKTASQMIALTILLATRDTSIIGANILVPTGVVLLYTSAGLAVWSLAVYMKKIWRVLLKL